MKTVQKGKTEDPGQSEACREKRRIKRRADCCWKRHRSARFPPSLPRPGSYAGASFWTIQYWAFIMPLKSSTFVSPTYVCSFKITMAAVCNWGKHPPAPAFCCSRQKQKQNTLTKITRTSSLWKKYGMLRQKKEYRMVLREGKEILWSARITENIAWATTLETYSPHYRMLWCWSARKTLRIRTYNLLTILIQSKNSRSTVKLTKCCNTEWRCPTI